LIGPHSSFSAALPWQESIMMQYFLSNQSELSKKPSLPIYLDYAYELTEDANN